MEAKERNNEGKWEQSGGKCTGTSSCPFSPHPHWENWQRPSVIKVSWGLCTLIQGASLLIHLHSKRLAMISKGPSKYKMMLRFT